MKTVECRNEVRREQIRATSHLNGLDYLDVSDDQLVLTVYFIGHAPHRLNKNNFLIEGGRRIRDIQVTSVQIIRNPDPELDDAVKLTLDRYGDFSTYTLRIVNVMEPIDPLYDSLEFTFKINCPRDLDCKTTDYCPPETFQQPEINYLAKDYAGFRQLILDRLSLTMPQWRERHVPDIGIALVEVLAYSADYLSYYQDSVATEAYLHTSRRRISVRRHARLIDYRMHEGCNARVWVCLNVSGHVELYPQDAIFVSGLRQHFHPNKNEPVLSLHEAFEMVPNLEFFYEPMVENPTAPVNLYEEHNAISFYTWGQRECCLLKGATSATLRDEWVETPVPVEEDTARPGKKRASKKDGTNTQPVRRRKLKLSPGDVLIFEEVIGPGTGKAADSDPRRRHAVRITSAEKAADPLGNVPIVNIEWDEEDALPFALCLSSLSDAEHGCVYNSDVSVARGNVVAADHGLTLENDVDLQPNTVPSGKTVLECIGENWPMETGAAPVRYRPRLTKKPLTFRESPDFSATATGIMQQNWVRALPCISLCGTRQTGSLVETIWWEPGYDLLSSRPDDTHFAVEIDNNGVAHLRFGDNICGRAPEGDTHFSVRYRVGNGKRGEVGANAISHLVYRNRKIDGINSVRNPLASCGACDAEPITEVKMFAPRFYRKELARAIVAQDYAEIAQRDTAVQRAGARLCWNGSWYEVQVAIDPIGSVEPDQALIRKISDELFRFRRMGHDLRMVAAMFVYIDLRLEVCVNPSYQRSHVKTALLERFGLNPPLKPRPGLFHPDNLTFGTDLFTSRIIAEACRVEGVDSAWITVLQRQFEKPDHEIETGVLKTSPMEIIRCDNDPDFPEHGRCEIVLHGGR